MSRDVQPSQSERIEPATGLIWLLVAERGSLVTIRPLGSMSKRRVSYAEWITWEPRRV
jgi:hypothetical protein